MIWSTRRDIGEFSLVLFRDRCPADALVPGGTPPVALDSLAGAARLNGMLMAYGACLYPPRSAGGGLGK